MPDYKRKHRSRFKSAPKVNKKRVKKTDYSSDIEMSQSGQKKQKMRVVKGKKLEQKRRFKALFYLTCILLSIFFVAQLIMPAGVFETVSNSIAVMGSGKYPVQLESSDTLSVVSKGTYYYVLTDRKINIISNSGKLIYSYTHCYENPVLKTSKTRALLFDQGGTEAGIFTLGGLKYSLNHETEIINAAIGEDGSYAFVTSADNYAAAVSVYKKNNKRVFEWFSSNDMVNNIAIASNGKKIAVSTMSSAVGNYNSRISILNFKSADAEYTKEFPNNIIYDIDAKTSRGFSVVTENSHNFISWRGKVIREYKNEYSADMFRNSPSSSVMVFNRESDKTDNRIEVYSNSGKQKEKLEFKGIITDIQVKGGSIYCLSDTNVYILDDDGTILRTATCGFGAQKIAVIGQNTVAVITDDLISEIKLK